MHTCRVEAEVNEVHVSISYAAYDMLHKQNAVCAIVHVYEVYPNGVRFTQHSVCGPSHLHVAVPSAVVHSQCKIYQRRLISGDCMILVTGSANIRCVQGSVPAALLGTKSLCPDVIHNCITTLR